MFWFYFEMIFKLGQPIYFDSHRFEKSTISNVKCPDFLQFNKRSIWFEVLHYHLLQVTNYKISLFLNSADMSCQMVCWLPYIVCTKCPSVTILRSQKLRSIYFFSLASKMTLNFHHFQHLWKVLRPSFQDPLSFFDWIHIVSSFLHHFLSIFFCFFCSSRHFFSSVEPSFHLRIDQSSGHCYLSWKTFSIVLERNLNYSTLLRSSLRCQWTSVFAVWIERNGVAILWRSVSL